MVMEAPALNLKVVRAVKDLSPGTLGEILKSEGEEPYFRASDEADILYVDNDAPRDGPYTEELVERTLGFALVDTMGRVYAKFKKLDDANKAIANAKINFDVTVEGIEQEETTNGE